MPRIAIRVHTPEPAAFVARYREVAARLRPVPPPQPRLRPWARPWVVEMAPACRQPPDDETGVSAVLNALGPRPNIFEIVRAVAGVWGVTGAELVGASKALHVVHPRMIAMVIVRHVNGAPLSAIGRRFGRDHATVYHADQKYGGMVARVIARRLPRSIEDA